MEKEQLNFVVIGHVDHGKSTLIGRLLADTNSLPEGKLESVKAFCEKNSRVFEYAFLLDALKEEQAQGITIDAARCFFKTQKRDYMIIDAPGHTEFIKNMITGAAKADACFILIDAKEGIQKNSKRHGYIVSLLDIKQVVVIINKMDLVNYSKEVFDNIQKEYNEFLTNLGINAIRYIPVCARDGENILSLSKNMEWYKDLNVIEQIDDFKPKGKNIEKKFRFPIQDVYKFTEGDDERRILSGKVVSGTINAGDEVVFFPSNKKSIIKTIEIFPKNDIASIEAGFSCGFTLNDPLYIKSGEIMCKTKEQSFPQVSRRLKVNLFWMGEANLLIEKSYKIKIGTLETIAKVTEIINIVDSSELSNNIEKKTQINKYDVVQCVIETAKPISFDLVQDHHYTGRFVIIDNFEIAGCGIVTGSLSNENLAIDQYVKEREIKWDFGLISREDRAKRFGHKSKFILITGKKGTGKRELAIRLEKKLFESNYNSYYINVANLTDGLDVDLSDSIFDKEEFVRRMGELARLFTGCGIIFITALDDIDDYDLEKIKKLNMPYEILVVNIGENNYEKFSVNLNLQANPNINLATELILEELKKQEIILEYYL
ncbi:MAG: adenylyl-sulfate kinase [Spirochaetes bacterium GWD1_27_9]|nr:MAG: adenylyl-sulfate kinase [Spirochaetes bacterium GWB1_27_13]OHD26790.1 MAG: adenylyl-sulfate kinase [Spirochaetes bacterium GWC1_27_15]OHD33612.1 MAG: adenylyl-sulfate kinase [Spirochaetes bacterium GWD1_27_9]